MVHLVVFLRLSNYHNRPGKVGYDLKEVILWIQRKTQGLRGLLIPCRTL
jgi:hypothetical protein